LGEILQLLTVTIVREDVFNLFGFLTQKEQDIFNHLISVSKIGPKLGINILSGMSAEELKEAIILGDIEKLNSIPGIGRKTAERIVLELKEKVSKALSSQPDGTHNISSAKPEIEDALSALINLGYKKPLAETAIKKAKAELKVNNSDNSSTLEVLIRGALKILSGKP
jgi:Holliday junction DNA helicase RuvA